MTRAADTPQSPQVISMGCRLNAYEGEAMRRLAEEAGLGEAVIINSCAVTNEAVRQTRQTIRRARKQNPAARIIVTGCAAQIDPASFEALEGVSAVIGNQEKLSPDQWRNIAAATPDDAVFNVNDIMSVREAAPHLIDGYGDRARAFVQVQNGCDHRCTFCIIPFGRGNARSAPIDLVVEQTRRLVASGHKEIVLTGVDITSYGPDLDGAPRLGDLVDAVLRGAPDLFRLRLSSIDGAEVDDRLFALIAGEERIAPHIHLSLQAGSNMILKRMKRRHSREQAIDICGRLRSARPDIALGADLIAGFPTETEEMFAESLSIIDEAGLDYVHVFPFSPREGTPAARMPQLPRSVVKERAARLREKADAAANAFHHRLVGGVFDAVAESGGRARLGNFAQARLPQEAGRPHGDIVRLQVTGVENGMLTAVEA